MEQQANQIETWAIVEIMGHIKLAGFAKTEAYGSTMMLRVDVPELPEVKTVNKPQWDGDVETEETKPAESAYTRFFGLQAVFSVTPCDEETAKRAADRMRRTAPKLLRLGPEPAALPAPEDDGDSDDPDEFF